MSENLHQHWILYGIDKLGEKNLHHETRHCKIGWQKMETGTNTNLLSFPGYICVYSSLNFLAKSMNAFIGRFAFRFKPL